MATRILKSLAVGYVLVLGFLLVMAGDIQGEQLAAVILIGPILVWPAILIIAAIVFLILMAIEEHKS